MNNIKHILDKSVYGHTVAKRQIEKIIGEWITGEPNGYCFGFEGPPGVGKTSLAKYGLALCLKDNNNDFHPFSMMNCIVVLKYCVIRVLVFTLYTDDKILFYA